MATSIWFVNGSSRGVGLEFVKQLSTGQKNRVIAGARKPADSVGLQHLKDSASNVTLVQLDQTDPDSIKVRLLTTRSRLANVKALHSTVHRRTVHLPGLCWLPLLKATRNDMTRQK